MTGRTVKESTRKAAGHLCAVIKGILFIGFTIQILLGTGWMCGNFLQVQDFAESDSALYRRIFRLCGEQGQILYLLQLAFAFYVGYRFLMLLCAGESSGQFRFRKWYAAWGSLAILTFPFSMQCHLALQQHSFMSSLFLLMLSFPVEIILHPRRFSGAGKSRWRKTGFLAAALLCAGLVTVLSGVTDRQEDKPGHSLAAVMTSRVAWPDLWHDYENWPEDLQEITGETAFQASCSADDMEILWETIENSVGQAAAREYYRQIVKIGWENHSSAVMHRIVWDVLGYSLTPLVFRGQIEGRLFDSYTGRNYEAFREHMPVFTRHYVEYGCWWFGCCLVLSVCLLSVRILAGEKKVEKRGILAAGICVLAAGILVVLFTMRGAGRMDYKCTIAVNGLWLIWVLGQLGAGADFADKAAESGSPGQVKV